MRILYRLGKETLNDIIRTGWVNIVIITTMAAILMIFATCFRTALSISTFSKELGKALEISVYLKNSTDAKDVKQRLQNLNMWKILLLFQNQNPGANLKLK